MSDTKTILLCGVGGQGTILAADLLARAASAAGLQVKVSEIHGMAQRGGAVTTVVRFGSGVHTMVADEGECDCQEGPRIPVLLHASRLEGFISPASWRESRLCRNMQASLQRGRCFEIAAAQSVVAHRGS